MNTMNDPNEYPKGWDRARIARLIALYENQSDEEMTAEDEQVITPAEARQYLAQCLQLAARAIDKLSDEDVMILYQEQEELERQARAG